MKGYKGLEYKNNILRGRNNHIYEIGLVYEIDESELDKIGCDFGYHYCTKIECVLGWRNYLIKEHIATKNCKLFEIEILGDEYDSFGKKINRSGIGCEDLITNKIKILREIESNELIEYFETNFEANKYLVDNNLFELFEEYQKLKVQVFTVLKSNDELLKKFVEDCPSFISHLCTLNIKEPYNIKYCENCNVVACKANQVKDYHYTIIRNNIISGDEVYQNPSYLYLKNNDFKDELIAIDRVIKHNL